MRNIVVKVYKLNELSTSIQDKVIEQFRASNEYIFLKDNMIEYLKELLKDNNIEVIDNDSLSIIYSLGYCQGDGVMFKGIFKYGEYIFTVKQHGNYTHYNSKDIDIYNDLGLEPSDNNAYLVFDKIYISICRKLEDYGYKYIEYEDSEEVIREFIEYNRYEYFDNGQIVLSKELSLIGKEKQDINDFIIKQAIEWLERAKDNFYSLTIDDSGYNDIDYMQARIDDVQYIIDEVSGEE